MLAAQNLKIEKQKFSPLGHIKWLYIFTRISLLDYSSNAAPFHGLLARTSKILPCNSSFNIIFQLH